MSLLNPATAWCLRGKRPERSPLFLKVFLFSGEVRVGKVRFIFSFQKEKSWRPSLRAFDSQFGVAPFAPALWALSLLILLLEQYLSPHRYTCAQQNTLFACAEYGALGAVDPSHNQPSKEKQPRELCEKLLLLFV